MLKRPLLALKQENRFAAQVSHSRHDSMVLKPPFSNLARDEGCTVAKGDNSCRLDRIADSLIANFDAILARGP